MNMNRFECLEMPSNDATLVQPPWEEPFVPRDETYYMEQAELALNRGDFDNSLRHYSKALGMNPNLEDAWLGQVRCLLDLDEVKEARVWVNKALEQIPRSAGLLGAKSLMLARMMEDNAALETSDKAFSLKQYSWYLWFTRGCILLKRGLKTSAFCFEKALEFNPGDWRVRLRVGMAYLDMADYHQALTHLRQAAQAEPINPLVLYKYGLCCASMGWRSQALVHYEKALEHRTELEKEIRAAKEAARNWNPLRSIRGFLNRLWMKEA